MTRDEMCKRSWKPYMSIDYKTDRMELAVECLLSEINFDNETMTLTPINEMYEQKDFVANIKFCSVTRKKMTAVKLTII